MFINQKLNLHRCLALTILVFAQTSTAATTRAGNIYHPTTVCALIEDIIAANSAGGNGPNIIDLGGLVFELEADCFTRATATCGLTTNQAKACYANGTNYSHGPTGLPEIEATMSVVNGRIVRGVGANEPFRIITVADGGLSLFKVTLESGDAEPASVPGADSGNGGAVYVASGATLILQSSKVGFNLAADSGGGLYVAGGGTLDIQTSVISNNKAAALNPLNLKAGGGGIYLAGGSPAGSLGSLDNSTVSHNTTPGLGGGLNNQGSAANILNSTFSYNLNCVSVPGSGECENGKNPTGAGGGIYNDATATLLQVTQSTFFSNRALIGGGIYNEEARASGSGVGIYLNNNTIAHNFTQMNGGGLNNTGFINQFVANLVGDNIDFSTAAPDIWSIINGTLTGFAHPALPSPPTGVITEGFNFVGDCGLTAQCQLVDDVNFDIVGGSATVGANIDPRLHRLEWKGGPTETVAPFPDSPAVNNGYNNFAFDFDQRGRKFFRTVGQTDIGSFEVQYDLSLASLRF